MKTPHPHAELIKAWADGAQIEAYKGGGLWIYLSSPTWNEGTSYRIKPEPKPDVVYYGVFGDIGSAALESCFTKFNDDDEDALKLTFDGKTGKLKSAEVL